MEFDAATLVEQIGTASLAGLVLMTSFANMFPVIPEEFFLLSVGVATHLGVISFPLACVLVWLGLWLVDTVLYYLVRHGSPFFGKVYNKLFGKTINPESTFVDQHLGKIVFLSRFVMVIRFIGPFLAGYKKMPWRKFFIMNAIALALYVPAILSVGAYFSDRVMELTQGIQVVKNITLIVVALVVLIVVVKWLRRKLIRLSTAEKKSRLERFGITKIKKEK